MMPDKLHQGYIHPLKDRLITTHGERRLPDSLTHQELANLAVLFYENSTAATPYDLDIFIRKLSALTGGYVDGMIPLSSLYKDQRHSRYVEIFTTEASNCLKLIKPEREQGHRLEVVGSDYEGSARIRQLLRNSGYPVYEHPRVR